MPATTLGATGLARAQEYPTYRALHRVGAGPVQGLLALIDRPSGGACGWPAARAAGRRACIRWHAASAREREAATAARRRAEHEIVAEHMRMHARAQTEALDVYLAERERALVAGIGQGVAELLRRRERRHARGEDTHGRDDVIDLTRFLPSNEWGPGVRISQPVRHASPRCSMSLAVRMVRARDVSRRSSQEPCRTVPDAA
jgi:hypothetical protein